MKETQTKSVPWWRSYLWYKILLIYINFSFDFEHLHAFGLHANYNIRRRVVSDIQSLTIGSSFVYPSLSDTIQYWYTVHGIDTCLIIILWILCFLSLLLLTVVFPAWTIIFITSKKISIAIFQLLIILLIPFVNF